jgi:hypothetical protein
MILNSEYNIQFIKSLQKNKEDLGNLVDHSLLIHLTEIK